MTTVPATTQTFEQKLKARIKDSIGDMISDDDLAKLVARGMEEVFFSPRPNPKKSYYSHSSEPDTIPPLLHEIVKECLQPAVDTAVKEWITNNTETVSKIVEQVVTNGVGNAVVSAMNSQFHASLMLMQQDVMSQLAATSR